MSWCLLVLGFFGAGAGAGLGLDQDGGGRKRGGEREWNWEWNREGWKRSGIGEAQSLPSLASACLFGVWV